MYIAEKIQYLIAGAFAVMLIVVAFVMEYRFGLEPCPLCILQRIVFIVIAVLYLLCYAIKSRKVKRILLILAILFALVGIGIAGRHVWIQHFPENLPSCLPSMSYLFEAFPLLDAAKQILGGTEDCRKIKWKFMGLSIPEQTLIIFCLYLLFGLFSFFRKPEIKVCAIN